MRLNAYVLAADPWWLENSISAYYDRVDRIVVSYDETHTSWTGTPLPVSECLARIRAIDTAAKCMFAPGPFAKTDRSPLEKETYQRRQALALASSEADWVLQLDTDEVIGSPRVFFDCLDEADRRGASAMEYPSRYLYAKASGGRFLEASSRFWRLRSNYPAPMAVRAGSKLRFCRQLDAPTFRVDFSAHNTEPRRPFDEVVHRVVGAEQGIIHYSWIRDDEYMVRKAGWSGHTEDYQEPSWLRRWRRRRDHPYLAVASTPFMPDDGRFRLVDIDDSPATRKNL